MAAARDALWPAFHVSAVYMLERDRPVVRIGLDGRRALKDAGSAASAGFVLAAVRREDALSPDAVQAKFDQNAPGWNGNPESPLYGHFRWMRRIMAESARPLEGKTVLDAGCGAGWVGIEAALLGGTVSAFDPSPEMVRITVRNGEAAGVRLDVQVGFGEHPPFPDPFDVVISSGVISFSPDHEGFMDGLAASLKAGGTLVLGEVNPSPFGLDFSNTLT